MTTYESKTNRVIEITFNAQKTYHNPFIEVLLDVEFIHPNSKKMVVPAFWAGGNEWKVRFSSPMVGTYPYCTICNADDNGLADQNGQVEVVPYKGDNPFYKHGPIGIAEDQRHFKYHDGTPFLWLADTWWKALSKRLSWEGFQELCEDRRSKGFNTVQIVCGPYPDEEAFEPGWDNEGGTMYADKAYTKVNPEYFNYADRRLDLLVETGLMPALVGAWGRSDCNAMKIAGVGGLKRHWRYLVARYAAYPLILVPGGEVPGVAKFGEGDWGEVVSYLCEIDPFNRLKTSHEYACPYRDEEPMNDFEFVGGSHFSPISPNTLKVFTDRYDEQPTMPLVCGETGYEGHMQRHFADTQRYVFWMYILNGAAGHTYGAAGLHHMGVEGDLGLSPTWDYNNKRDSEVFSDKPVVLCSWDYTTWQQAKEFLGATQVGIGRKLLETYPWHKIEPHQEWSDPDCYSAGIPGELRFIYRPNRNTYDWTPPRVKGMEENIPYNGYYFDPVTGRRFDIGTLMKVADHPAPFKDHKEAIFFEDSMDDKSNWELLTGIQGDAELEGVATTSGELHLSNRVLLNKKLDDNDIMVSVEVCTNGKESAGIVLGYKNIDNHIIAFYDADKKAIYLLDRRGGRFSFFRIYEPLQKGWIDVPELNDNFIMTVVCKENYYSMRIDDGTNQYFTPPVKIDNIKGGKVGLWQGNCIYKNVKASKTPMQIQPQEESDKWLLRSGEDWAPPIPSPQDWVLVMERSQV
ncbi:MAG: DUF4038 domain-containing protein [Spirochaetaceae bacterium]